jgi:alanine dehydrogenase
VDELTLGVVATSRKEHENRLAIHPRHVDRIDPDLRGRTFLERGYGLRHGYGDDELEAKVGGLRSREQLIAE